MLGCSSYRNVPIRVWSALASIAWLNSFRHENLSAVSRVFLAALYWIGDSQPELNRKFTQGAAIVDAFMP